MSIYQSLKITNAEKSSYLVFISILFLTFMATYFTYKKNYEKNRIIFENKANNIPLQIEDRMKAYEQVLLAGVAKFNTTNEVTRNDWKKFIEELKLLKNYPGIQGIGFSLMIKKDEKEAHIQKMREEGFSDYDIKPAGQRDVYTSIIFLEPFDNRNKRAFGYDMFSQKTRNEAMSKAMQTGEYSLSGKVHLLQENGVDVQAGFLAYIPVYKKNITDIKNKIDATYGFVYAPFRAKDLINSMESDTNRTLDIEIYDGKSNIPDDILYDSNPTHKELDSEFRFTKILSIGGRSWFINIVPTKNFFEKTKSYEHIFIFFIGLIISIFVFILINIYYFYERKKANYYKEINALAIRKELALKAATIGTWEWEYKTNNIVWDNTMYEIYGIEKSNQNPFNLWKSSIESSQKNYILKNLFDSKRKNIEHNINFWIKTKNGEKKFIHSLGIIELDDSKKAKSMIGINIDITEYELNKEQLLKQNLLIQNQKVELETIFNHSTEAIALIDLKTNFLIFNDTYLKLTEFTNEELENKNYFDLVEKKDIQKLQKALKESFDKGFYENLDIKLISKNNREIKTIMSIALLPDKNRFLISSRDFTELKKKEKIIKDYVDLIDKYVITSSTNLYGIITSVSEAFCKISGYSKEELIGKNHNIIKHPHTNLYDEMWANLSSNKIWIGELRNIRKDGKEYWVKATISPIYDEYDNKIGYTAIREDITDKKIIEEISITDGLTNIYNRRYFNELFPKYIQGAKRKDEMIGFIIIDVDYFKQYNDNYGHQKGDEALKKVAKVLKNSLNRADDYCFRLGGEEFGIVFKVENTQKAFDFAILIKNRIESEKIEHKQNKASDFITVSMGLICDKANNIQDIESIYKNADEMLYKAKENGRNQVVMN